MEAKKKMNTDRIVFLDVETTGFDPKTEQILEIAVIVTDRQLMVVDTLDLLLPLKRDRSTLDPWIQENHAELLDECAKVTEEEGAKVETLLAELLARTGAIGAVLAGNSVGDFDRHFLREHMPGLNKLLSHRSLNVSTFRVLADLYSPHLVPSGAPMHRALADCETSILLFRHFFSVLPRLYVDVTEAAAIDFKSDAMPCDPAQVKP